MNPDDLPPVDWQKLAKDYCLAEFNGSLAVWDSLEFAARCESFMPSRMRREPARWLQWIHPSYPGIAEKD